MRTRSSALPAVIAILALSGCAAPVPVAPGLTEPTESASSPPLSDAVDKVGTDSESEDEIRARAAFEAYVAASDAVAQAGGVRPETLAGLVTSSWLEAEVAGFTRLHHAGLHQVGDTVITVTELAYVAHDVSETEVALYACQSTENLRIVDARGESVSGPATTTLVTVFVRLTPDAALVDAVSPAADSSWCLTQ